MKKIIIMVLLALVITMSLETFKAYVYSASNVTYSNSNLNSTNAQTAVEEIYRNKACPYDNLCYARKSWKNLSVGDYVRMTPTKESYNTDTDMTGATSKTIYPRELNLWRVIRKNNDGTIDMISEYATYEEVPFYQVKGYANFVGYLNILASQYENDTYTIGSRYFGYNGQTEFISDTSAFDRTSNTAPWTNSTTYTSNQKPEDEDKGAGDTLYSVDVDLVTSVYGSVKALKCNDTSCSKPVSTSMYWLASRQYNYYNGSFSFNVRTINGTSTSNTTLCAYSSNAWSSYSSSSRNLRPIVTLKSNLNANPALGTKSDPYILP